MASRWFTISLAVVVATLALLAIDSSFGQGPAKPAEAKLVLLDGTSVPFRSLGMEGGKLTGDGIPAGTTLDDLRRIELPGAAVLAAPKSTLLVELVGGGRVRARDVSIASEKCQLVWNGGEPFTLSVDLLRAIHFDPATSNADFEKAVRAPSAELDRVFIKDDAGKLSSITGLINSLDAEQLKIAVGGQEHAIPRAKLLGMVLAQPAASDMPPHCLMTFRDGSALGGETLSLAGDKAILGLAAGAKVEFSWSAVAEVIMRSKRVAFLSDLKPTAEDQQAIVTLPLPAQRDKSAMGKPLTLGTRTYEKGLGVHARSSLTFATDKKWDVLAATIGLDATAGGKGDCVFVVLADGQSLLERRIKGSDAAEEIQLVITGREQVTLVVEPGAGLDLADHADWCDVRFIKNRE
jgi:NPCBM/NEW2 domain-containing protein